MTLASNTQLTEIRRLSHHHFGHDWPTHLAPTATQDEADRVLRALLAADGIYGAPSDPDLTTEIRRRSQRRLNNHPPKREHRTRRSPAESLARLEKKGRTQPMRKPSPDETWLEWAATELNLTGQQVTCDACGGNGTFAEVPTAVTVLQAVTGSDSPTLTVTRARKMLTNPDLETLRRVEELTGGSLDHSADIVEALVEAFATHPARAGRRKVPQEAS